MIKKNVLLILLFTSCLSFSQSNWKKFKKLSSAKKIWIIFHPFKAKKAQQISKKAYRVADSIKKSPVLDGDGSGGQVDAFRHAFWMASLRQEIGKNAARSLGKAHERENYQTYKKRKLEDGVIPDKIATTMDLFNNNIGLSLTKKGVITPKKALIYKVINAVKAGRLKIIKKDANGNFLTCNNTPISEKSLKGKWENNKCLVNSNHIK
ncbi:DUF6973 domain-containing protein [Tenacibaculum finnmarkense]|uniref:DUF6973 domain-containing protein n=1 Tax=Tenacibaculum finnmarkense genomovar finnmarkense TaxID=1458503 RepID=A0AAP1RDP8_9FLAO|nr:hypothetical protein [Tenacibaculum finnmarkense]MBE7651663.1 hypothetical protein [Tenacibaculum finnmarkense genomovar finnmarkense]MBE7692259.1 hypothetical protein [Tenacibaculum finnmarkense genomovar finnmarkense]MBE7693987.1 hypothetical protein [Tenacibaculum finnmarkense genomovar finnmarkense]MCD8402232.1 hypothetical protein [Tenacibaculum finnmarkense genomovar finnmarkense]MCD8411170.1 hypothetical protein [Tenacibaculum finnmarkense genomovar ulcerans]